MALERFHATYKLTDAFAEGSRSAMNDAFPMLPEVSAGVYNQGEITLLADSFDLEGFSSWPPSFLGDRSPLAMTAFGDFFFWNAQERQVDYLETQRQKLVKAASEPTWFIEGLL